MNLVAQIAMSDNMECPPGVPSFFLLHHNGLKYVWQPNAMCMYTYFVFTFAEYMRSRIYFTLAVEEITNVVPVRADHWRYNHN